MSEDKLHECFSPKEMKSGTYGEAYESCYEDNGEFWITNGEYASQVNYCPICGMKAPKQIGEKK